MTLSLFQSPLYQGLFGDPDLEPLLSEDSFVQHMILFERKLALVQGRLGVIPEEAGIGIDAALADARVDLNALAEGVRSSGVPVPALVAALRQQLPRDLGQWIHWGATSQDVIDTAHVLGWQRALDRVATRLSAVLNLTVQKARACQTQVMAGRTRSQIATPITFGLRIAQWGAPLIAAEHDVAQVRAKLARVQFGGAAGGNTAVAPHGPAISKALAAELGLADSPAWHTNRSGIMAAAHWLLDIATALDKMAGDLILMSRSETSEVTIGAGGGSSTMPQKANPVGPETIRVLAGLARAFHGGLTSATVHAEERDGTTWPVEWVLMPQLLLATGAALRVAQDVMSSLEAKADRMEALLAQNEGILAEQASFALAASMPRSQAQQLVKEAVKKDIPFKEALSELAPEIDWDSCLDLAQAVEPCTSMANAILADRRRD